jgi:hypothetical protein
MHESNRTHCSHWQHVLHLHEIIQVSVLSKGHSLFIITSLFT